MKSWNELLAADHISLKIHGFQQMTMTALYSYQAYRR